MTWNIHKGVGGVDRRYDLDRTMQVLDKQQPDIALLQEVAQGIPRLRRDDQVARLQALDGPFRHSYYHPEHRFRRGVYGNLILSRFPLHDTDHLDLTIGSKKQRGLITAHAIVRMGSHQRTVALYNMHLGLAGSERARQLQRFIESHPFRGMHRSTPLIVGGDLNDLWGTLGPRFLRPAGLSRAGQLANSFPSAWPLRPLDGLFFRGDLTLTAHGVCRDRLSRAASDHLPIWAEFQIAAV